MDTICTEENYDRVASPQNVIVSDGAKQAIWNVLFALLNPQDEVIVLAPYWVSYPDMVRMIGGIRYRHPRGWFLRANL